MKFESDFLTQVKQLFDQRIGSREIAEKLGCTRWRVQQAYKELGIYNIGRHKKHTAHLYVERCCKVCKLIKPIGEFRKRERKGRTSYENYCKICENERNNERLKLRAKRLRKTDPHFKVRTSVSFYIWRSLNKNNSIKSASCLKYLPYTIEELKQHLESKFEPWMTWENYGTYNRNKWDDQDPTTWRWQIDHIIPQSDLSYSSMTDENFKKCWALENLRPYSAKQNIIDGTNMLRHSTNINI